MQDENATIMTFIHKINSLKPEENKDHADDQRDRPYATLVPKGRVTRSGRSVSPIMASVVKHPSST